MPSDSLTAMRLTGGDTVVIDFGNGSLGGFGAPTSDVVGGAPGEIFIDLTTGTRYEWNAETQSWDQIGSGYIQVSPSPPSDAADGSVYLDPTTGIFYIKRNGVWIELGSLQKPGGMFEVVFILTPRYVVSLPPKTPADRNILFHIHTCTCRYVSVT